MSRSTLSRLRRRLLAGDTGGAVVMLVAALAAVVLVNAGGAGLYDRLVLHELALNIGGLDRLSGLSVRSWVNDGAMTFFFLLVTLQIKEDLVRGDLRHPRVAALPVVAAVGGMLVPAAIYLGLNAGGPGAHGWGVPMATDIAFAVAVVALAGDRVPPGGRLLLLALAVVDDLGAIAVIAVFYTAGLQSGWLGLAVATVCIAALCLRAGLRAPLLHVVLGVICWFSLHESGVHPTMAGVAFGFLVPVTPHRHPSTLATCGHRLLGDLTRHLASAPAGSGPGVAPSAAVAELHRLAQACQSPLDRLTGRLTGWVVFGVVPVFAFTNAGVPFDLASVSEPLQQRVALGVGLGLLVGKVLGVFGSVWLVCRLTLLRMPRGVTTRHLVGLGLCAGVGFTVALFISDLASPDPTITTAAKGGVLVGSLLSGVAGYLVLRSCPRTGEFLAHDDPSSPRVVVTSTS
jgi:NhaA family Na+:H+ antiporter